MPDLTRFANELTQRFPTLDVTGSKKTLVVRRGPSTARLRVGAEVATWNARERRKRRTEGLSFLDLETGSLFIDEPGLFVHVRLPRSARPRLSPFQCALLSALLERGEWAWFELGVTGPQVDLIRLMRLELEVDIAPMAMSRFLEALRGSGILREDGAEKLVAKEAYRSLREDFRLSAVGRAEAHAGNYRALEGGLEAQLGQRFVRGVAEVLLNETGAWIEPRDYLVDRSALAIVRASLGSPVPRGYKGPVIVVRPALRVPLGLLTLGRPSLQPLLGLAEATRSESPVARQASLDAWEKRARPWK